MKNTSKLIMGVATASLLFTGCATTSMQTNAQMTQTIFLSPVKKEQRVVFVDLKNTSGHDLPNLEKQLQDKIVAKGYTLTDDPELAKYILLVNVLFADDKKESNTVLGATSGAAIGAGVTAYNTVGAGNAVAGGLAGMAIGGLISKLTEDTIYQMIVDINVREKTDQKVITSTAQTQGQATINNKLDQFVGALTGNSVGTLQDNTLNNASQQYETNYIDKKSRVFAEATQMGLDLQEAIPVLEEKMSTQISGIF